MVRAEPHALAYSFIAIQILVLTTYYPIIYWNCACLITNSGGEILKEEDVLAEIEEDDDEDEENDEVVAKKKEKNTDYGRVATAIGNFQTNGIQVRPPDINQSSFTFTPVVKDNIILYGLRGIARISGAKIIEIMRQRPYLSLQDFLSKNKLNKTQIVNLIKSGAFDRIEDKAREEIMADYIDSITDKKQRLTLQNMQMLITQGLIPEDMQFYAKLFQFNKFLKTCKDGIYYSLNDAAVNYISHNFDADLISNGAAILQSTWDNLYKKRMEPMRQYLKVNKDEMLHKLNDSLYNDNAKKYADGSVSKWEMDSISFYYHDHELKLAAADYDNFFDLSEDPEIEYSFETANGQEIQVYKLHHIIGTVIDKDKVRSTVTLLTPTGVVNVRVYKNQFASYDKQLSERGDDGKKHVIEKSWFSRGTKIMVQGIRRGNDFVPKKTKKSPYPIISKIINIDNNGILDFQYERVEVN